MILPALIDYYDRLEADPSTDVAARGFSRQKISFVVTLKRDGTLVQIADAREAVTRGKSIKLVPRSLVVPGQTKSSGNALNPCFLWDRVGYLLGWSHDDTKVPRARRTFERFREIHLSVERQIDDSSFSGVCRFLESWSPETFVPEPLLAEYLTHAGVFRIQDEMKFVHERDAVRDWFVSNQSEANADIAKGKSLTPSLVDGRVCRVARLHEPGITGVPGARSGAKIVSFEKEAFRSYGKSQGDNAPVAEQDAFKYCTALNRLLADDDRRAAIGDATVVWWTDGPADVAEKLVGFAVGAQWPAHLEKGLSDPDAEVDGEVKQLARAVKDIASGRPPALEGTEQRLNVLGLAAPSKSRLSVRFWWRGPISDMIANIAKHNADMTIGVWVSPKPIGIQQIIGETGRLSKGVRDRKTVPPRLSGDLARSILLGLRYPESLRQSILRRIRQDGTVTSVQARTLKAIVLREGKIMSAHLNPTYQSTGYQCGRLFATLSYAQQLASPTVKSSISARYMRAAMATPGVVLGRVGILAETHIRKIESSDAQQFLIDEIAQINGQLPVPVPVHLLGTGQTEFMIGYYKELMWLQGVIRRSGESIRTHRYRTDRGDWVRSKLEKRVINTLLRHNIQYVYEPERLLGDGIPRRPDLLIPASVPGRNVYIEVAGGWKDMDEYDRRHEQKLREYDASGITEKGGEGGVLRILDFRNVDMKKGWYDEKTMVIDLLADVLPVSHVIHDTDTISQEDDR